MAGDEPRNAQGSDLAADLDAFLAQHGDELIEFRRDLHAHPELANAEHRTTRRVALRLAAALEALPEAQREALVLHYWQGLTLAEVAGRLGRTPPAVAGLLQRGLKALRTVLKTPE